MRIGVDLLPVDSLDRLHSRGWFTRYIYAPAELAEANAMTGSRRKEYLAGRFAAKEAVLKVIGTGLLRGVTPRDIAVVRSESGAPRTALCGSAERAATAAGISHLTVSITHSRDMIAAVAFGWKAP
ncbi:MAG TPA: holo-ACP synthase [Streptosporangiaceae bacterium]|jgi:holo-[acyl-carrier protein] synthase